MISCAKCSKQFTYKKNLIRHEKDNVCVKKDENKTQTCIKCPECAVVFSCHELFRSHVSSTHEVNLQVESHTFQTYNDFMKWKGTIKKEQLSYYHMRCSKTVNGMKRIYLNCHRFGYFFSESKNIRRIKSQGTNKIDAVCTSFMNVEQYLDRVVVTFGKTHFGHGSNIGRCYLTKEERAMIAGKIKEGVGLDKILDEIRDNVNDIYDPKTLMSKCDVMNVRRDFNLIEGQSRSSDYISVKMWIESNLKIEGNPILHHNLKEDNVMLVLCNEFQAEMLKQFGTKKICIDSTHGTNEYDMHLTKIVVVDEFGNGFPTVFCQSSRKDTDTWKSFFEIVRNRVGVIKSEIFMSDDDPAFYNGWLAVMGPVERKLLCSWHVDQSWRRQIQSAKINGSFEKKSEIYKTLKILHQEPDSLTFEDLLRSFLEELELDKDTIEFGRYFRSTYSHRVKEWAYCYRLGSGINTNMYLESIHKRLKYLYLHGKKNKRLDKCLNALQKFIRDTTFSRFIKLVKNKYTLKENNIAASHTEGMKIQKSTIQHTSEHSWIIPSSTQKNLFYDVSRICDVVDCKLKCRKCNICTHLYVCDCPDHILKLNICKHIHACVVMFEEGKNAEENQSLLDPISNVSLDQFAKAIQSDCNTDQEQSEKKIVIQQINTLLGIVSVTDYDSEEIGILRRKLESVLSIAFKNKRKITTDQNETETKSVYEPPNKKITKQLRFVSNKKKNHQKQLLENRTTINQKQATKEVFGQPKPSDFGRSFINIHQGEDHSYF